jgi:hypothetical protein
LLFSAVIGCLVSLPGLFFLMIPYMFPAGSSDLLFSFLANPQGLNNYFPVTLFFIWGTAVAITLYCHSVFHPYKKIRDEIKQMEKEFSDALYILGKRISEEKSPEESFSYAAQTMEGARIAEVFRQTSYNLIAIHTNLHDALFSDEFGSLKYVYSDRIKAVLRLFVEGTQKSQRAASASLIRIADHLKQLQEVENKIKDMLYELTSTLRTTVTVFAPLIAGVTLAITTLISTIISSLSAHIPTDSGSISSLPFSGTSETFIIENVRPEYFVLVIGVYLIELVFLLTRFTNGINEGDDNAMYMVSLGKNIPMATIVFSCTIIIGQYFFSQIITPI